MITEAPAADKLRVVIVAPIWLQNVLSLWLQAVGKIPCVTGATTFAAVDDRLAYDWVIFAVNDETVDSSFAVTIQTIQQRWPAARLCIFVDDPARQAEIDQVAPYMALFVVTSPQQILTFLGSIKNP